jgi:peptidyl-prolyl cis-trans isomerase A (cyclophilin A)
MLFTINLVFELALHGKESFMFKRTLTAAVALLALSSISASALAAKGDPHVLLTTSAGNIELELNAQKAPVSVKNFVDYVNNGFYNNTIFHRVIPGFMVQGGGFTTDMQQKQTNAPIKNEADNGLRNLRGTIAMARTAEKDSATSQFFINVTDNAFLDHGQRDFGYAVFGKVVKGMDVADKMAQVPTKDVGPYQNVPSKPIVILSAKVLP